MNYLDVKNPLITASWHQESLHFFESNGGLYVFVNTSSFGEIRILAVERIRELTQPDSTFQYPDDFDPGDHLNSAFDMVYDDPIDAKIWFSADQARYIKERTWVKGQKIRDQADGSIILEISTSGWRDVKKWILSFGAETKVIEPSKLRDEIIDELKKASRNYRTPAKARQRNRAGQNPRAKFR